YVHLEAACRPREFHRWSRLGFLIRNHSKAFSAEFLPSFKFIAQIGRHRFISKRHEQNTVASFDYPKRGFFVELVSVKHVRWKRNFSVFNYKFLRHGEILS